jgi:spoIIIJ-associated protein
MNPEQIRTIEKIIIDLLEQAGIKASVEAENSITAGLIFNITTPDSYLLIGRGGTTLHALQFVVWQIATKSLALPLGTRFTVDVDDYKRKREWYLKETAKQAAQKIQITGHELTLEPMPSYERRIIHAYIQEHCPEIESSSVGYEPRRRVVLRKKQ